MNINKHFGNLLLLSLGGILAVTAAAHLGLIWGLAHPILAFSFGILPMLYWHYLLWESEDLNQTQIDTIYFFGFLVTLVTLGCAATFALVPSKQATQVIIIVYQFALGLLATGYGLLARVLLTNRRVTVAGPDDAIDQYLQKIGRVLARFEETVALFDRFRDDVVKNAREGAAAISQEAIVRLESELRTPLEGLRSSISAINEELKDLKTSDNLRRVNTELGRTALGLEGVASKLTPLAEVASASNQQILKAVEVNENFSSTLDNAIVSVTNFKQEAFEFTNAVKQINLDFAEISRSTKQLVDDFSGIDAGNISMALSAIAASFKSLSTSLNSTNSGFSTLDASIQNITNSLGDASGALKQGFSEEANAVAGKLRSITSEIVIFSKGFQSATADLEQLQNSFQRLANEAGEFGKNDTLGGIQKVINELIPLVSGTQTALTGVQSLVGSIELAQQKLKPVAEAAANEMGMLSQDLQISAKALGGAMTTLASSVKRAAEELSGD